MTNICPEKKKIIKKHNNNRSFRPSRKALIIIIITKKRRNAISLPSGDLITKKRRNAISLPSGDLIIEKKKQYNNNKVFRWKRKTLIIRNRVKTICSQTSFGEHNYQYHIHIYTCIYSQNKHIFYALRDWKYLLNHYCFCPVCHFVFLFNFFLALNFEQWVPELNWYYTWIFQRQDLSMGTNIFNLAVTLTSEFDLFLEIFYLADNFWPVSARAMIFDMSISSENPFPWLPTFLSLWPWRCSLTYFLENFNFANDFLTVRVIFFIICLNISCDKISLWVLNLLTFTFDLFLTN